MVNLRKVFPQLALILALTYLTLLVLLFIGITPERVDIQVGLPAPTLIKASKDIVDTVTTEANREKAANAVTISYMAVDPAITANVMADYAAMAENLAELRSQLTMEDVLALTDQEIDEWNARLGVVRTAEQGPLPEDEFSERVLHLTRDDYIALINADEETFAAICADIQTRAKNLLDSSLPEGQEESALRGVVNDLSYAYGQSLASAFGETMRICLRPNMCIDEAITEENRQKARDAVEPVTVVKDEVIVREGSIVTEAQYTMISSLGILREDLFDVQLMIGMSALVFVILLSTYLYLYQYHRFVLEHPGQLLLLCVVIVATVALSLLMRTINGYAMPLALGVILIAALMDTHVAMFANNVIALLGALLAPTGSNSMYATATMTILCALPILLFYKRHKMQRSSTLVAGLLAMVVNCVVTFAFGLFTSAEMSSIVDNACWAAAGGILSAIAATALQPLMEWIFNQPTAAKLVDLSNPEQKLLRRLQLETPGTYHHSIIVANLAEAACVEINANALLARVGAYYHDIGKLKRPLYFRENQLGPNPHDVTEPMVSAQILIAHARDGALMAQKERLPQAVVDIIQQHHGNGVVRYFYGKVCEQAGGESVSTENFRYPGPCPQTREAGVVMLADTVEAATRTIRGPNPQKIDEMIRKLVREKLDDGQLNASHLTFNDLETIQRVFSAVLTGVYHERIEYPDVHVPTQLEEQNMKNRGNAPETVPFVAERKEGSAS